MSFGRALPVLLGLLGAIWACGDTDERAPSEAVTRPATEGSATHLPPLPTLESTVTARNPLGCIDAESAAGFSFADQVTVQEARGFRVRYDGNVKYVTVQQGDRSMDYALVQCGTPVPEDLDGSVTVIEVPIEQFVTTSTTELPAVVMLEAAEGWIGHGSLRYVSSPILRQRIDDGAVFEAGAEGGLDVERVIAASPDVVFADTYGDSELGVGGQLDPVRAAGIDVVAVPSYLENSPLGRAEWLVFVGLFLNREAQAADLFAQVSRRYDSLAALVRGVGDGRPLAITGAPVGEVWHVPGGGSYMALMLADAGIDTPWADDPRVGSLALAFEAVWHRGRMADWWIQPSRWRSRDEIVAADARLADVPALVNGNVVISDRRLIPGGGNDFWEAGHARPDLMLADLIHLVHPDRLPDHALVFLRRLGTDDASAAGTPTTSTSTTGSGR